MTMQPQSATDYKQLLSEVIKKQIVILGPDITLSKARNVKGITVADDGTVTDVAGSPQEVTQALIDQFVQLSGLIVKKTMEPLLSLSQPPHQDGAGQATNETVITQTVPAPPVAAPVATSPVQQPTTAATVAPGTIQNPVVQSPTSPAAQPNPVQPAQAVNQTQPAETNNTIAEPEQEAHQPLAVAKNPLAA